ncbi:MAG: hypothetical protein BGO87_04715 [Flavobacteriia bacterium 40-80]|nr:MAG: hypothetical protein BGO87_04715 [Flavobacteriia bacterium 40-80]
MPKLLKNKPGDVHEKEADRAADEIIQKSSSGNSFSSTGKGVVQAKTLSQTLTPRLQLKEEELQSKEDENVQLKEPEMSKAGMTDSMGGEDAIRAEEIQSKEEDDVQLEAPEEVQTEEKENVQLNEDDSVQTKEDENVQLQEDEVQLNEKETPVQTKCTECESREKTGVQTKCEKCQEKEAVQAKSNGAASGSNLSAQLTASKGGGTSMAPETQQEMGSGFGADFSDVKIHTGTSAVQMSKSIGAQAFTHGKDIYFNNGKYAPGTTSGKHLLAHELAHTIQQKAVPGINIVQRQAEKPKRDPKADAQTIVSLLEGWTDSVESHQIYKIFQSSSSGNTLQILSYLKDGTFSSTTGWDMVEWLMGDVTDYDRKLIVKELVRAKSPDATRYVAKTIVNDLIAGYTSQKDYDLILYYINLFDSSSLPGLLDSIKKRTGGTIESGLFGELNAVTANALANILYSKGGAAVQYAAYYAAKRIENLLAGWTGVNDGRAIVRYFREAPTEARALILSLLNGITKKRWGQTAEDALMKDMYQEDYDKLKALGVPVRKYDIKKNWLEKTGEAIVWGLDYGIGWVQYLACGVVGAIWGILAAIVDIVLTIGEAIIFGIPALIGWMAYHVTGGKHGRDGYEKVNKFFSGFSKLFNVGDMWGQVTHEADMIEGSFSECRKAFHYTNKVFQTIVNIILIFAAGYGIVKGVAKLTKFAGTTGRLGKLKTVFKGTKSGLVKGGKVIASIITKPRKILAYSKTRINKMLFAAANEGYFMYLRNQPMKYIAKERAFWKEYRRGWKKSATKQEVTANELEQNYTNVETQKDPLKAEKMAKETNQKTEQLNKETHNQLEEIKNGKNTTFEKESSLSESANLRNLKSFSGTEKARAYGATPNSIYTYLSSDKKFAVSNYIYNSEGKVVFQVDFSKHGKFFSGHGHNMDIPGNLGSGHTNHIPWNQVPPNYLKIPNGLHYSTPIGQ